MDESGTHQNSPVFVLGGLAIHEQDAWHFKQRIVAALTTVLPAGLNPNEFELHAADIKTPRVQRRSRWANIPIGIRFGVLRALYASIASYKAVDSNRPLAFFGAVVDRAHYADYELRAYEEVLHKFDEMLNRHARTVGQHERGVAVHDNRDIEDDVQSWTNRWRHIEGRIGVLNHMAEVPLFADSRASRLIQASDFITWALWRYYGLPTPDERWIGPLWRLFDSAGAQMDGLIHVTPAFPTGECRCPPCASRLGPALPPPMVVPVT